MSDRPGTRIITDDVLQPFQMAEAGVRGRMVRLGSTVDDILNRHDYPEDVARFLGETLVLAAMLGGALKFEGIFTVQTKGDGAITMLAADMTTPGSLRGYAAFDPEKLQAATGAAPAADRVRQFLGSGYVAFTIDSTETDQRYQGIVELEGDSLAECMENYFDRSEQLQTRLTVSVAKRDGKWRAGGLMIQRLPHENGQVFRQDDQDEAWRMADALVGTVTGPELTDPRLLASELLYRLFHEGGVWLYDPVGLMDRCSCSGQRVLQTLSAFPVDDLAYMAEDGVITADCQFCNAKYSYSLDDVAAALSPSDT